MQVTRPLRNFDPGLPRSVLCSALLVALILRLSCKVVVAVRVEAARQVDSVAAVEAVETADASLSYLKEVSGPTAHLFCCVLCASLWQKYLWLLGLHHHVSTTER